MHARTLPTLALAAAGWLSLAGIAAAQDIRTYTKKATFDDIKFGLDNAIVERGLVVDYRGAIGRMLERTGADVGSTTPLYTHAEYVTFCSAKLSRRMMEADLTHVGFCPYVVFLYEPSSKPGEVVIGYRRPALTGGDASKAVLAEIDALLDGIVNDALK